MPDTERPESPSAPKEGAEGGAYGRRQWLGLGGGVGLLVVLLGLPAPEGLAAPGWRAAAVALLMALWWMTEALPIAATALLPLVLFPLLDVAGIREAAAPYANPLIFLFMGGFIIAMAMVRWQLHRRIALSIIRAIGVQPSAIVLGFMAASAFLSMWVSNTATAMMMLPIGLSVIELVRGDAAGGQPLDPAERGGHFATVLMLAIAYACSIGGMATLVGTPTNALLAGFMDETYGVQIAFFDWLLVGVPLVLIALPIVYLVLTRLVYPIRLKTIPGGGAFIARELAGLGPMQRPEKMVAGVFGLVAALWIGSPLLENVVPGLSDTGIAMAGAVLLFMLPVDAKRGIFLLDWETARKLPWGVLILFGGGLSLADAINQTGLAAWIGTKTAVLEEWPLLFILAVVVAVVVFLTELTSNTATAAAFVPVVASVAIGMGQNPLLLAVPTVLAASCAFMLPVATPPNAIVYGSGMITIPQMARAGIALNVVFIVLITVLVFVLLPLAMDVTLGVVPDWATIPAR